MAADRGAGGHGKATPAWGAAGARAPEQAPKEAKKPPKSGRLTKLMKMGRLTVERHPDQEPTLHMGQTVRSFITGEVRLQDSSGWPDFDIVDLWSRNHVEACLQDLHDDKYLFVPIPLAYRTWLYHDVFLQKKVDADRGAENSMLLAALQQRCIDENVSAGRSSPMLCYGPMVLVVCFTGDMFIVLPGIFTLFMLYLLAFSMNTPSLYRFLRPACILPRLAFIAVLLLRASFDRMSNVLAVAVSAVIVLVDFVWGDLGMCRYYKLNCHYEVMKVLPNRVFVCRRVGASHYEQHYGTRGFVDVGLTGLGTWPSHYHLIADIHGMVVELRPVTKEQWVQIYEEQCLHPRPVTKLGVDTYGMHRPSVRTLDCGARELIELCAEFDRGLPRNSLLRPRAPRPASGKQVDAPRGAPATIDHAVGAVSHTNTTIVETNF